MRHREPTIVELDPPSVSTLREAPSVANFGWMVVHLVLLRLGWIFKTESIVIPVFMQFIGGGPVLQGLLMVSSRLGMSVPPVLLARRLKVSSHKKWPLALYSFGMALPFALLSLLWYTGAWQTAEGKPRVWMPLLFLLLHGLFFTLTGINQLAANALQGKLIAAHWRGRLFMVSLLVGSPIAVLCAALLMPGWLAATDGGFGAIFGAAAVAFVLAGLTALALREPADQLEQPRSPAWHYFGHAWQTLTHDQHCRALAVLAVLFSTTFMLFPHYQAVVRRAGEVDLQVLALWVCVQNVVTALVSLVVGPMADRWGNRAALRLTLVGAASTPLVALGMMAAPDSIRYGWAWLVFVPIGFTPVTLRLVANYALEIAPREDHPRVVSALGLCSALPVMIGAPLVGWLVHLCGYVPVMAGASLLLLAAMVQSFRIAEPRQQLDFARGDGWDGVVTSAIPHPHDTEGSKASDLTTLA